MRKVTIGRSSQNDYVINDKSNMASRFHADLFDNGDGSYTLTDHSTYGTTVNGYNLHNSSRQVRYGDSIVFANAAQFDWGRVGMPSNVGGNNGNQVVGNGEKTMAPFAVAAMVLGILSIVLPYFSRWTGMISLVLGIIGLSLAAAGLKRTKNNRENYRGIGMLKAGLICSIITVAGFVLVLLLGLIIGASLFAIYR